MKRCVRTHAGHDRKGVDDPVFVENGGVFGYEAVPTDFAAGLLEGGTPECRGPSELLLYQRAQERMLERSLVAARARLRARGIATDVGLVKNCRDAFGNTYGAQENYEVDVATGAGLLAWRLALAALAPVAVGFFVLEWALIAVLFALFLAILVPFVSFVLVGSVVAAFHRSAARWLDRAFAEDGRMERVLGRMLVPLDRLLAWPHGLPFAVASRFLAFTPTRRRAMGFVVSRVIVTGTGSVEDDGRFVLCEKASGIDRPQRSTPAMQGRAVIDTANLLKSFLAAPWRWLRPYGGLFRRRQRLQLGLSDSNRAQVAEYLKVGSTCLVLDMIEADLLVDAPEPVSPVAALRAFSGDPSLQARAPMRDGTEMTALELQRWYLTRAREFVAASRAPSLEAKDVLRLWEQCIDALASDPGTLVGRLDWVTKRWLIEESAGDASFAAQKKVDLKYHELGTGYFARLERAGLAPTLVGDDEIERAITEPPARTPARLRGRLIKELAEDQKVRVDWGSIRIGGPLRGRVIRLDDYR